MTTAATLEKWNAFKKAATLDSTISPRVLHRIIENAEYFMALSWEERFNYKEQYGVREEKLE